jgi:putative membrane protein
MMYDGYHIWGMHLTWWFVWAILLVWIFATPYDVPFQRTKKNSAMDILKKQYASGQITKAEFLEKKDVLNR